MNKKMLYAVVGTMAILHNGKRYEKGDKIELTAEEAENLSLYIQLDQLEKQKEERRLAEEKAEQERLAAEKAQKEAEEKAEKERLVAEKAQKKTEEKTKEKADK